MSCFSSRGFLNRGTEDEIEITGYRRSWVRSCSSLVLTVLLGGIPYLVGRWRPRWRLLATSYQSSLREATRSGRSQVYLSENKIFLRIQIVKTMTLDVSIEDVIQEEVDREFPWEFSERTEGTLELRDTSRLLQVSPVLTFRHFRYQHLR